MPRLSAGREINFYVDAISRCGGACAGCLMTAEERESGTLWPEERFDSAGRWIARHLEETVARGAIIQDVTINLGQGDFLLLVPERAAEVIGWFRRAGGGLAVGYINSSAVLKHDTMRARVSAILDAAGRHEQGLLPNVVMDFDLVANPRFRETYAANLRLLAEAFGDVHVNLNLGPDVPPAIRPAELHGFVAECGFSILDLALVPTRAAAPAFAPMWHPLMDWLSEFMDLYRGSGVVYEFNMARNFGLIHDALARAEDHSLRTLAPMLTRLMHDHIYIAPDGAISPAQDGFGVTAASARFGFRPVGSIEDTVAGSLLDWLDQGFRRIADDLLRGFLRRRDCAVCVHQATCAAGSVGVIAAGMKGWVVPRDASCTLGIRPVIESLMRMVDEDRDRHPLHYGGNVGWVHEGMDRRLDPRRRRPRRATNALHFAMVGRAGTVAEGVTGC